LGKAKAGPPAGSSRREPWLVFHRCNKGVFAVLLTISLILALAFASPTNAAPAFSEGVFYIDGTPYFLWSADYPYYRDNRADWSGQLDRIKAMNVKIVTFYIPWRHHVVGDPVYGTGFYDFTGQTQDNRDVKYFIDLIRQKGLYAIVKPGPFVHAELDYGGLPQYVSDAIKSGKIEAEKDSSDLATTWLQPLGIKLPAALDPYYLTYVQDWLIHVNDFIVANNYQYPNGPIVAIQLLNEGIYSNARERITGFRSYDWSLSSRDEFRNFIQNRYGTLDNYNAFHGTSYTSWNQIEPVRTWANPTSKQQALAYLDWA
ncbi:beta-galactosidase, partial [Candidatus Hakubella thermalkaliphila]